MNLNTSTLTSLTSDDSDKKLLERTSSTSSVISASSPAAGAPVSQPGAPVSQPGAPVSQPGAPVSQPDTSSSKAGDSDDKAPPNDKTDNADKGKIPPKKKAGLSAFTDANVGELVAKMKLRLSELRGNPDIYVNPEKYCSVFKVLPYGTFRRINPQFENRKLVGDTFFEGGILQFVNQYWEKLNIKDMKSWEESAPKKELFENFYRLLVVCWNVTDLGVLDHLNRVVSDLLPLYFKLLVSPPFSSIASGTKQPDIIKAFLGTAHNVVNKLPQGSDVVRALDGVKAVTKFVQDESVSFLLRTKAVLVLSYLLRDEDGREALASSQQHIKYIINVLKHALESDKHFTSRYGYEAEEVADGLNRMALLDTNKTRIVEAGALPLYAQLMTEDCTPAESSAACAGLWTLAFNSSNRDAILSHKECIAGLRKLSHSTVQEVKTKAQGALWQLEGETQRANTVSDRDLKADGKHIMISYCHAQQPQVRSIKERLDSLGYKTWMDIDGMTGSTLEAMAFAIENAAVVLMFFSDNYKKSQPCRAEAAYMYRLGRDFVPVKMQRGYSPDGWLGMLLGARVYFDYTKSEKWEATFDQLVKEIGHRGHPTKKPTTATNLTADKADFGLLPVPAPRFPAVATVTETEAFREWKEEEVKNWLKESKMDRYTYKFDKFTGEELAELRQIYSTAPEFFYDSLKRDLNLQLIDVLRFTKALRELK